MLVSAVQRAARRNILDKTSRPVFRARYHWRRFHIDETGHDWDGTNTEREPRTIHVKFSSVPKSMVDALHGIRAIERQFGRIRDYRLLRDSEIRSDYQAIFWAAFESPGSLLRVPPRGTTLEVALPPLPGRSDGGPGLNVLTNLLVPSDCSSPVSSGSQNEAPNPARVVTLKIKRADSPLTFRGTVKPPFRSRAMKAAIGHRFLEWSGFASLEPLHTSSPFTSPSTDLPLLDSKNMRIALNKWSQILGVADPSFPEMKQALNETETKDAESDWEPLSQPPWMPDIEEDAARELEMPRGAQENLRQSLESLLQRTKSTDAKVRSEET